MFPFESIAIHSPAPDTCVKWGQKSPQMEGHRFCLKMSLPLTEYLRSFVFILIYLAIVMLLTYLMFVKCQ